MDIVMYDNNNKRENVSVKFIWYLFIFFVTTIYYLMLFWLIDICIILLFGIIFQSILSCYDVNMLFFNIDI